MLKEDNVRKGFFEHDDFLALRDALPSYLKGRTVYLGDELRQIFEAQYEARKKQKKLVPYIFPNKEGDEKIGDFRGAWNAACKKAGIGKRLFHDFRRTAVRNMIRSGIPERIAMMLSGHKTRRVQLSILKKKMDQPLHQIIVINPLISFGARGRN
ncbi:MAG: tyrosine-type recombinase/integrase [Desulfobacterales bacterium]